MDGANRYDQPVNGHFGEHGGRFVAETLTHALDELTELYDRLAGDPAFQAEFQNDLVHYVGRPTPLYFAERLTARLGGAQIYLKREDLNHTGAHKVNNTIGQALLAKAHGQTAGDRRDRRRPARGGHGHRRGPAGSRVPGLHGRGRRQATESERLPDEASGRRGDSRALGFKTLKDAMNEAMRDWVTNVDTTHYIIGTVAGPDPYPRLVRDFQSVIGKETRTQCLEQVGRLPDVLVACVGGGSNAIGLFHPFLDDQDVRMVGVEAGGFGLETGRHAAPLNAGKVGVLHGNRTYLMQDEDGQIIETHSVSAGLDYPGVGPEHSHLKDIERAEYHAVTDDEAMEGFRLLNQTEGIMPALESSHALAWVAANARELGEDKVVVINLSGRGDKDILTVAEIDGIEI